MKTKLILTLTVLLAVQGLKAQFSQILVDNTSEVTFLDSLGWAFGPNVIHFTSDYGDNWSVLAPAGTINGSLLQAEFIDANIGFVVSNIGEIYKTSDGGSTWSSAGINLGWPGGGGFTIDLLVEDPNTLVALFHHSSANHIFRTADQGLTWSSITTPNDISHIEKNHNTNTLIGGLYATDCQISNDNGASWTSVNSGGVRGLHHDDNKTYILSDDPNSVLYISSNNGSAWNASTNQPVLWMLPNNFPRKNEQMASTDEDELFIAACDGTFTGADVFYTLDGGNSWNSIPFFQDTITSFDVTEKYIYIGTDYGSPSGSEGVYRFPNPAACNITVAAAAQDTLCVNGSLFGYTAQLGGSPTATGGTLPYTYEWSFNGSCGSLDDTTAANPIATVCTSISPVYLTVTDANGCVAHDTVILDTTCVNQVPCNLVAAAAANDTLCVNSSLLGYTAQLGGSPTATGGTLPYTYEWSFNGTCGSLDDTTASNPIATVCTTVSPVYLTVTDANGCVAHDTVVLDTSCTYDVWPGDANSDGIASIIDILPIGIAYGSTGPVRSNASLTWVGQPATDWGTSIITGADYKHADCDGNGIVDQNDLSAILLNYGLTHSKGEGSEDFIMSNPSLIVDVTADTIGENALVTASVKLGDNVQAANNIYGVTFSLNYDPALIDTSSVTVSYNNSWLGNISNPGNMIALDKNLPSAGRVDVGLTRTDQANNSGMGEIASIEIFTIDDLTGKQTIYETLKLMLSNVRIISNDESIVNVNLINDSIVITDDPALGISDYQENMDVMLYPNPAKDVIRLTTNMQIADVYIYNAIGQAVLQFQATDENIISVDHLENGIYNVIIVGDEQMIHKKLILE
ncbi:MAG: T9SS type A sorting domain-containing protein [Flavobacteriales bacterium]|nr:T9SS type A sorting domain-containing protein [Flavobacteriales bacterium]